MHSQAGVERIDRDMSCKTPRMMVPEQRVGSEEIYVPKLKHRPDSTGGAALESPRKQSALENGNIVIAPLEFIVTTMKGGLSVSSPSATPRGTPMSTPMSTPRDGRAPSGQREKNAHAPMASPRDRMATGTRMERMVTREPPGPFSPNMSTPRSGEETVLDTTQAQVEFSPQYPDMRYQQLLPHHGLQQARPGQPSVYTPPMQMNMQQVHFPPHAGNGHVVQPAGSSPHNSFPPPPQMNSVLKSGAWQQGTTMNSPRILYQGSKVVYSIPGDEGGSVK